MLPASVHRRGFDGGLAAHLVSAAAAASEHKQIEHWHVYVVTSAARFYLMIRHGVLVDFQNLAPYKEEHKDGARRQWVL